MKSSLIYVAVICLNAPSLQAQEPLLPRSETQEPAQQPTPVTSAAPPGLVPSASAPQLISPDILPLSVRIAPAPSESPSLLIPEPLGQKTANSETESRRRQVEWRRLRNIVVNHAEVKKAMLKADSARTDLEKRKLLRSYYDIFFGEMAALAGPDMKPYLVERKNEQLNALPQPHVRPDSFSRKKPRE